MKKFIILNLAFLLGTLSIPAPVENIDPIKKDPKHEAKYDLIPNNIDETGETFNGIIPSTLTCPKDSMEFLSEEAKVSQEEKNFSKARRPKVNEALLKFFKRTLGDVGSINLEDLVKNKELTVGLSFSGGGYKSLFTGAGQLLGLDERTGNKNPLSGILQASSYISGADEANWLIGSLAAKGFPVASELFNSLNTTKFSNGLITPFGDDELENQKYWSYLGTIVREKNDRNYAISLVDILGGALAYQLLDAGNNKDWTKFGLSDVRELDTFKNADMPYPLLLANVIAKYKFHTKEVPLELSPYKVTSWGNWVNSMVDTKYFGSYLRLGEYEKEECFIDYDNLGFLMAITTSRHVNLVEDIYNHFSRWYTDFLDNSKLKLSVDNYEGYSLMNPNPFESTDYTPDNHSVIYTGKVDSAYRVPLESLSEPERDVDVIFLFDNTNEDNSGSSTWDGLVEGVNYLTSMYMKQPIKSFWDLKDKSEKNLKHSFLACDAIDSPLYIYIPNGLYTENTTIPANSQAKFTDEEIQSLVNNGLSGVSLDSGKEEDKDWATCVACAMLNRGLLKNQSVSKTSELPEKCTKCLKKYCVSSSSTLEQE